MRSNVQDNEGVNRARPMKGSEFLTMLSWNPPTCRSGHHRAGKRKRDDIARRLFITHLDFV